MNFHEFYACGGFYGDGENREFRLVKPSGKELPYVADNYKSASKLFHLCRHHANLYKLFLYEDGSIDALPYSFGDNFDVDGMDDFAGIFMIPLKDAIDVCEVVANEDFWA